MENSFSETVYRLELIEGQSQRPSGHPWLDLSNLRALNGELTTAASATVYSADGQCLGSGVFDPRDPVAVWRRFSWEAEAVFDANYVADAIQSALERRSDEACQRLIHSDADYLPGLIVEIYGEVILLRVENAAIESHLATILEIFVEMVAPREIVIEHPATCEAFGIESGIRTHSGQNLKGFWFEIDEIAYRLDLLNADKPRFFLDQREQHSLVGSLCAGRRVLDAFATQAAFALQALRHGAAEVVAVDHSSDAVKAIGANSQKNQLPVQAVVTDVLDFLSEQAAGSFDCIILDPPEGMDAEQLIKLQQRAFSVLDQGGVLATYCRAATLGREAFESMVAEAASTVGREGRVFARISQPFDFPVLLNLPESAHLKGLILQVE